MLKPKLQGVMLDMSMPELSGEETLRQIRDLDPDVPVIVTSGHDVRQLADRLGDLNISGTLQKPFRLSMLRDELRRALTSNRDETSVMS
jgi:DNA-binding NtrC family response regulator